MDSRGSSGRPAGRGRTWLGRGALVLAGVVVGLGLTEIGLRLFGLAPPPALFTVTQAEYQRIPGTFAPDQRVIASPGTQFEHITTINDLGYRGAEFSLRKPPGQLRVLFAGDSFTWGHNVNDDETTPARLQRHLQERCGSAVVANAGLSGTSILAHETIIERGLAIDPDAVILMYHENDIDELIYSRTWEQLAANRRTKSRFPVSVIYPLVRTSALWNLAQEVRRIIHFRNKEAARGGDQAGADPADSEVVQRARTEYRDRLAAIQERLDDRDVPFVFVTYPHPESVRSGAGGRDYDWVVQTATELGLPVLDLLPHLGTGPLTVEEAYLVPDDYHPSQAGHDLAATVIAEFITGEHENALPCGQ